MRRSRTREEEEYDSGEYESGEYESGDYESADYETPYPRKSKSAPVFAIGGIALAFLAVILAYYFMIYQPEQKPVPPPPRMTKEKDKGPDLGKVYQRAVDFAEKNPKEYLAVVKCFEDVAEALKGTPYEEKAKARAAAADKKWTELANDALAAATKKSAELAEENNYDAALKAAQEIPEKLLPPVKADVEELTAQLRTAATEKVDAIFRGAEELLEAKSFKEALVALEKAAAITYTGEEGGVAARTEAMRARIVTAEKDLAVAKKREIQDKIDSHLADFDALVSQGKYKEARTKARDAIQGEQEKSIIAVMNSAADLAGVLMARTTARKNAMLDWAGKDVTLNCADDSKKVGSIRKFSEKEIEMQVPFKKGGAIGSIKEVIDVSALAEGELDRLLPPPRSTKPDEWMADAVKALNKGDQDAAKQALGKAAGHPLENHYRSKLGMAPAAAPVPAPEPEPEPEVEKPEEEAEEKPEEAADAPGPKGFSARWGRAEAKGLKKDGSKGELPFVRSNCGVAYDSKRGLCVMYGGDGIRTNDLWAYDGEANTWQLLQEAKNADGISRPPGVPSLRCAIPFTYDPTDDRYLLFLGARGRPPYALWSYDPEGKRWTRKFDSNQEVELISLGYHAKTGKMVGVSGGRTEPLTAYLIDLSGTFLKKTPTVMSGNRATPSFITSGGFVSDGDGKYVMFGGMTGREGEDDMTAVGDTWLLDPETGSCTELKPINSPSPRSGASMCYHAKLGAWVLFGGDGVTKENEGVRLNDTWVYHPGANNWVQAKMPFGGPPSAQRGRRAVWYDAKKEKVVMLISAYGVTPQTWFLDLDELTVEELKKLDEEIAKEKAAAAKDAPKADAPKEDPVP
ncbi:hypothetical protein ACFL01_00090 [Planctomycetota bacterium]